MKTRAKLVCLSVIPTFDGSTANLQKTGETVAFETRYNGEDSPEDNSFTIWTPSASMSMHVTNPELDGKFEVGRSYYFDITPCEA